MRIIASDYDNTLYVQDDEQFKRNIEKVREFINKGNIFIIITGRSFSNIKQRIIKYNIPYSFLVCQDGANIFDKDDKCLKSHLLDINKAKKLSEFLNQNEIKFTYESAYNDNDTIENATKITIGTINREVANKMNDLIKKVEDVYAYVSARHVNIIDSYVNKSMALKFLIDNNYIDKDLVVIGDDINDYEMLKDYNGVVMKIHDDCLNELHKEEINSVEEYIGE